MMDGMLFMATGITMMVAWYVLLTRYAPRHYDQHPAGRHTTTLWIFGLLLGAAAVIVGSGMILYGH